MELEQNLALFRELMLCDGNIFSWCYDASGQLLFSNCPDEAVFAAAFEVLGCLEKLLEAGAARDTPTFLSSDTGLIWGAAFEKAEGQLRRCHVIGPVFYSNVSVDSIYEGLMSKDYSAYSDAWLCSFREALGRVPTSQHTVFSRNLRMLHYCVTGQRIDSSEVFVVDLRPAAGSAHPGAADRHRVYGAEKAMLKMVTLGDLNYQEALSESMNISDGVPVGGKNALQRAKVSAVVFCTLVCRAAMEGGLSPEEGYSLGDAYIQSALDASRIDEISAILSSMYDDFVRRVHRCRENPRFSEPIRRCCDYIEMNLGRELHARELAGLVGYSIPYFTRRFRAETGYGISDYVKAARIERAKILLETSDHPVQEIAEKLGFTTRNYFTRCFREVTGMTPVAYRSLRRPGTGPA